MQTTRQIRNIFLFGLYMSGLSLMVLTSRFSVEAAHRGGRDDGDTIAEYNGPLMLDRVQTRIVLKPVATRGNESKNLAARIKELASGRRIYLVLRDLRTHSQPGVLYWLYLDLPPDAKRTRTKSHHVVGTFNFFNADEAGDYAPNSKNARFFSYDVTETLKNLQAQNLLRDETTLSIIPSGTPAPDSRASIGRIELVEQ